MHAHEGHLNGANLVSNIVYQPFGAPKSWTWGNGAQYLRQFDLDGHLSQYPVGADARSLNYDDAGRITLYSHTNTALDHTFNYDANDRLTGELDSSGAVLWSYDLNGNRTSLDAGTLYDYSYAATSNKLLSVAGPTARTYSYDAAGNIVSDGVANYLYYTAGRLSRVERGTSSNKYRYNALDQRTLKWGSFIAGGPYRFVYNDAGRLIGEYNSSNAVRQETVWLSDTPVAVLKPDATGVIQAYYVQADHLNAPRAILDSGNRVVWKWNSDAFGQGLPYEDPDQDGIKFEYNLRLPGQYYDKETGLHYNYFRDYDPGTGRYVQGDPIGLEGGLNVYTYVGGNPLSYTDPNGEIALPLITGGIGFVGAGLGDAAVQLYNIYKSGGCMKFDWKELGVTAVGGGLAGFALPFMPGGLAGASLLGGVSNLAVYKANGGSLSDSGAGWAYVTGLAGGAIGGAVVKAIPFGTVGTAASAEMVAASNAAANAKLALSLVSIGKGLGGGFASSLPNPTAVVKSCGCKP